MDKIKASQFADLAYYCRFVPPSRTITFAAPASTLTNFPALVKSNSTFNIGTSTGYDVHFQDLSGNELAYELDYYDSVTGNGAWWVKIPSLPSSGATSIKMLYGDSSASTNGSSPLTVWADYAAVYHFNEIDYSYQTNRATGTQSVSGIATSGSMSFQTASTGTGRVLRFTHPGTADDTTQAIVTTGASYSSANYSVSALWNHVSGDNTGSYGRWFNLFSPVISGTSPVQTNNGGAENVALQYNSWNGNLSMTCGRWPNWGETTETHTLGMKLLGGTFSQGSYRYTQINSTITSGNTGIFSNSFAWNNYIDFVSMCLGWSGSVVMEMDEIRACKSPHTQDWMAYEYSNYIDHSNCVTYGPEA